MYSSIVLALLSVCVASLSGMATNNREKNSADEKGIQFGRRNLNPNMNSLFFGKRSGDVKDIQLERRDFNPNMDSLFFGDRSADDKDLQLARRADLNPDMDAVFFGDRSLDDKDVMLERRDYHPLRSSTFFGKRQFHPLRGSTFFGKRSTPTRSEASAALSVIAEYMEALEAELLSAEVEV